jgi:periodic tryptophan protein 1
MPRDDADDDGEEPPLGFLTGFQWVPQGFIHPVAFVSNAAARSEGGAQRLGRRLGLSEEQVREAAASGDAAVGDGDDGDDDDDAGGGGGGRAEQRGARDRRRAQQRVFAGPDDDAYFLTRAMDSVLEEIESDDESEMDDTTIRPSDLVFVVGRAGDEPSIEVTIYDEPRDNIYVHHDAALVAPPLCVEWLFDPDQGASLAAVGTLHPYIELWCLDHNDAVDPAAVLGGCKDRGANYEPSSFRRGKARPGLLRDDSHTAAVTALRWNANAVSVLASGGADSLVKVWDVKTLACLGTVPHPAEARVQSLDWHPGDANLLLAACGPSLDVVDCRRPGAPVVSWASPGDDAVEHCAFLPAVAPGAGASGGAAAAAGGSQANVLVGSTESGAIAGFDMRGGSASAPLWSLGGLHGGEVTFAVSRHAPLLATAGASDGISLWQLDGGAGATAGSLAPAKLSFRRLRVGQCFALQFHPNSPDVLGAAGSAGLPLVYTITDDVRTGQAALNGSAGAALPTQPQPSGNAGRAGARSGGAGGAGKKARARRGGA